ncbi:MAG: phosphoheptose isomerase, partial [Desulfovibrio sp.]|nr:phosphoheptose isomerase [Desulfovibrio sp.]
STSGNSPNVLRALEAAGRGGLFTVGFSGAGGGRMRGLCRLLLETPPAGTPLVQELHIAAGHLFCQLTDHYLFENAAALAPLLEARRKLKD